MRDIQCVRFLQWALPRMGFRWPGYRRVRGQVCKRVGRRITELGLDDLEEYRQHLRTHPEEWQVLDSFCRITISRFSRDRDVFRMIAAEVLPRLERQVRASNSASIEVWCAGCGAGEEPYSLCLLAESGGDVGPAQTSMRILATDSDSHQIHRARTADFPASSLRELPPSLVRRAFEPVEADTFRLRERYLKSVELQEQDLRQEMPDGPFHLIFCRNLAFTYFDTELQKEILARLIDRLAAGGFLIIGTHEEQPSTQHALSPFPGCPCVFGPSG